MNSRNSQRIVAIVGGAALIGFGAFTAGCSKSKEGPAGTTTPTTSATTSAPAPSPTEKKIEPSGGNLFTPPVTATPAPNVPPGQHPGINGVS